MINEEGCESVTPVAIGMLKQIFTCGILPQVNISITILKMTLDFGFWSFYRSIVFSSNRRII